MIKFDNVQLSTTTRILRHKEEVIIGNIQYDGRWIKTQYKYYKNIVGFLGLVDGFEQLLSILNETEQLVYIDLLKKLNKIQVFTSMDCKEENHIQTISLELTTNCNLKCKHCSSGYSNKNSNVMDTSLIIKIVQWAEIEKIPMIVLTGGEIYTIKNIDDIIYDMKKIYKGKLGIITNATLITNENIKTIVECIDTVDISFDGYDEKSVDFIRGRGVFEKAIDTIYKLQEKNYKNISVSMVLTDHNKRNVNKFELFCDKLNVKSMPRILSIRGRALNYLEQLVDDVSSPYEEHILKKPSMISLCTAGSKQIAIRTNGEIKLCASLEDYELPLETITKTTNMDSVFSNIEQIPKLCIVDENYICKECPVRYFCSSNCMSINYNSYNNENLREKRCFQYKEKLMNKIWNVHQNSI